MTEGQSRRSAMIAIVAGGVSTILASLAGLVGFAAVPRAASGTKRWRKVASTLDISDNEPAMVVLSSRHQDGWYATEQQQVVFVDRDGDNYRVLSAVCTHLGCGVKWDGAAKQYKCPCHGGIYDREGKVLAGPPPRPLDRLNTRVNEQTTDIEVEL
jgi:Rieske Fe-S protein